ncbi:RluA family pseudouridine synthase [Anoxynatronum sibiricum]|uniref:Pseudouridine synthase n=1 Tax=Anoxynatronum sibiricum TaxID=210623 RepID=A0ABU9VQS7_9CLOT
MTQITLVVDEELDGLRLDQYLAESVENKSRSYLQILIQNKQVSLNGKHCKNRHLVKMGDVVELSLPEPRLLSAKAEDIPLEIVYEDEDLLVVNKPQKMVVHPAAGNESGTLVNALMYHCKGQLSTINGVIRPGIVHRIDKDTSGLLVVARNDVAHQGLAAQLAAHTMIRCYEAVAVGVIKEDKITVDAPIGRHPNQRLKMAVLHEGRPAVTHITVKERFRDHTYLTARLETGRTHQIRVHMAYLNHPLLGDERYGGTQKKFSLSGQVLHAKSLGFRHPVSGQEMIFESKLPDSFQKVLITLRAQMGKE